MADKPHFPGNRIMVRPDGPLICSSDSEVVVEDGEGNELFRGAEVALCRCGHSANKPFCDASHRRVVFRGNAEFADARGEPLADDSTALVIVAKPNGMLSFRGPTTLFSRSGESVTTRNRGALCRCGHSANKPFCDGSHKREGFSG